MNNIEELKKIIQLLSSSDDDSIKLGRVLLNNNFTIGFFEDFKGTYKHICDWAGKDFMEIISATELSLNMALSKKEQKDIILPDFLPNLVKLTVHNFTQTVIEKIVNIANVTDLYLGGFIGNNISFFNSVPNITKLLIRQCEKLTNINGLESLTNLETLCIDRCSSLNDISSLATLKKLKKIYLEELPNISDISSLSKLTNIKELQIRICPKISDISGLSRLTKLTNLDLVGNPRIDNIVFFKSLEKLTNLKRLTFSF